MNRKKYDASRGIEIVLFLDVYKCHTFWEPTRKCHDYCAFRDGRQESNRTCQQGSRLLADNIENKVGNLYNSCVLRMLVSSQ